MENIMSSFLEIISKKQLKELKVFEESHGDLEKFVTKKYLENFSITVNSFFALKHSMKESEGFCEPDLNNLIEYEKELNGRN